MNRYVKPETSPLFTPWQEPQSGVVSYVLTARCAPWQQLFYFCTPVNSDDGRYMWLGCAYPPRIGYVMGRVDFLTGEAQAFPETNYSAYPYVDPHTGEAWYAQKRSLYRRGPGASDPVIEVGRIGTEWFGGRPIHKLSNHVHMSGDRKWINLNMDTGDSWHVGAMETATGRFELWDSFDVNVNHSQYNPTDPDLIMFAEDHWVDRKSGVYTHYKNRIWTVRRGEKAKPLVPDNPRGDRLTHEWWSRDGRKIWFVDYDLGTFRYDLATGAAECLWPGGTCHSESDATDMLLAGDIGTYEWQTKAVRVAFYNRYTGREVDILSDWTSPNKLAYLKPFELVFPYHFHAHPQFILNDELIAYNTTVFGRPDVALVRVADLVKLTS